MTIGEHIMLLRKKKGLSQNDLGKAISDTPGDIIGRYERDAMSPSIDVIMRLAHELEVSIDYLVGRSTVQLDKNTLERLEDIGKLSEDKRAYLFSLNHICLRDFKTRRAYAKSARCHGRDAVPCSSEGHRRTRVRPARHGAHANELHHGHWRWWSAVQVDHQHRGHIRRRL